MKARVFVSSIMEGFSEFRSTAREAIARSGGLPILVEDYPSVSVSPRNACLDGVHSSDFLVIIIGLRGGELSVLYPLAATGYIWVSLLSVKLLKEKMSLFKWLGVSVIIAGITLIGLGAV